MHTVPDEQLNSNKNYPQLNSLPSSRVNMKRISENLIQDDLLAPLLDCSTFLLHYKWPRRITIFIFIYLIIETILCSWAYLTLLDFALWGRYTIFSLRNSIALCSYATLFSKSQEFHDILEDVLPRMWPLKSVSDQAFGKLQTMAKNAKIFIVSTVFLGIVAIAAFMPLSGDEYNIFLLVKLERDCLDTFYRVPFEVLFYISSVNAVFIIISNPFVIIYLIEHLKFQYFLLNEKLKEIDASLGTLVLRNFSTLQDHQDITLKEIVECIKLHQLLLHFRTRIVNMIYVPIVGFTTCGVVVGVSIIFFLKSVSEFHTILRMVGLCAISSALTVAFGISGQLLENEADRTCLILMQYPWHLLNAKNRKILRLLLMQSQQSVALSTSGLIMLNHQLFITLFRTIHSVITFLMNLRLY